MFLSYLLSPQLMAGWPSSFVVLKYRIAQTLIKKVVVNLLSLHVAHLWKRPACLAPCLSASRHVLGPLFRTFLPKENAVTLNSTCSCASHHLDLLEALLAPQFFFPTTTVIQVNYILWKRSRWIPWLCHEPAICLKPEASWCAIA